MHLTESQITDRRVALTVFYYQFRFGELATH